MRICGDAQILSCSLLVDTNIMLIFQGEFICQKVFFGGYNMAPFLESIIFIVTIKNPKVHLCPLLFPRMSSSSMF
jgi:hypothetical protein